MKSTSELKRIAEQMRRAFDGEAWHGPALMEILDGVNSEMAAARPVTHAHTIWELVFHIQAWEDVIRKRLHGEICTVPDEQNFPAITNPSDDQWRNAIAGMRATHDDLLADVSILSDERLPERVPGKDYDIYTMLHGSAQHVIYHAGQIVILKRALERNA